MKPMLAAATDGADLHYSLMGSAKLDGVRALIIDSVVMSRNLKPIPNSHTQALFGRPEFNGFDGELIVGKVTASDVFRSTMSGVTSYQGKPDVNFHIFDDFTFPDADFQDRLASSVERIKRSKLKHLVMVPHIKIKNYQDLIAMEEHCLELGYEGLMLRHLHGKYKEGRSTLRQGWLMKLKRFADSEAQILGFQELMHNSNKAIPNELGYAARSTVKAGMIGMDMMGALHVKDCKSGVEFDIGTGFNSNDRLDIWKNQKKHLGKFVKYKFFPTGSKDKPRFPVFLGFRDVIDM